MQRRADGQIFYRAYIYLVVRGGTVQVDEIAGADPVGVDASLMWRTQQWAEHNPGRLFQAFGTDDKPALSAGEAPWDLSPVGREALAEPPELWPEGQR
jgi:hypothetical protein